MIGGLQYLTQTRSHIFNVVGIITRPQVEPKETHLAYINKILRYLKGTLDYGSWYEMSKDFTLYVYTSANQARNLDDRKNTSGGAIFLGGRLVSWLKKNQ